MRYSRKAMEACVGLVLVFSPALVGPSHAESPYVHPISPEEDSQEGVSLVIESATQTDIMAPGYEKFNILGYRIVIAGEVVNGTGRAFDALSLTFSARDIFGKGLDSCEAGMRLPPGGKEPFRCVLDVKDARELTRITYKIEEELRK